MVKLSRQLKRSRKAKYSHRSKLLKTAHKYHNFREWKKSEKIYSTILKRDPSNHNVLNILALLLLNYSTEFNKAIDLIKKAIHLHPGESEYCLNLAAAYKITNNWADMTRISEQVLTKDPENTRANYYLGYALEAQREFSKSIPYFKKSLSTQPDYIFSHEELCAVFHKQGKYDLLREQLLNMEGVLESLDGRLRAKFCKVMGKYYDYLDEYDLAFDFLKRGNTYLWNNSRYDITSEIYTINKIISTCDENYVKRNLSFGHDDPTPVFIVGMPRSGTSLIEQILSSHPQVSTGGELKYLEELYLETDLSLPAGFGQLGKKYSQALERHRENSSIHVTDKMPNNFRFIGLIRRALPMAKIIHCVRTPLDTCFSCYKQDFGEGYEYSFDLEVLGAYYLLYQKLMQHWHDVSPGHILDVHYENVINNIEDETRKMLTHCNLDWDDSCLNFYNSNKVIRTASRDQVNRPIYNKSVKRWEHYEQFLEPLINALQATP